ncbi:hypothetical protein KIK06_18970 [Nocardiopsis sp. EMB25]|uniref:hypothetical protein n=1 Tax=Nocardiopsis sp. EMB25 TaxID=2835867 RepID=UPI00228478C2|nr:hypothetical protein [Nocardiopsis sp. EMB25]MCY9785975.1 hypothetical protein [Nocardiopsis sp. EMB25]
MALISMGFLLPHVVLQISHTRLNAFNALLPFGTDPAVAYGIIAADLLVVITVTGILRGWFTGTRRPWVWRVTHLAAYLSWPLGLVHGLTVGRAAPTWVVIAYLLCLSAVCCALVLRLVVTVRPASSGPGEVRAASEQLSPPGSAPAPEPVRRPSPHRRRRP